MTCKDILRLLLAAEHPDRPSVAVRKHLAGCPSCQSWHRRLVRLERQISLLPVPATSARERLVARLRQQPAEILSITKKTIVLPPSPALPRSRIRYVVASAAGLAAAAVLFALIGWWVFPRGGSAPEVANKPQPDPLLASLMEHNMRLAKPDSARQRIEVLADVADLLCGQVRELARAADAEELKRLARLYEKVVREGVVARAGSIPADQHGPVLGQIAQRLTRAGQEAERRAGDVPAAAGPLRLIANAAREGDAELRKGGAAPGASSRTDEPASPLDAAAQALLLKRNFALVDMLVDSGLRLAAEESALKRAEYCQDAAEGFAGAMGQAAAESEGARVVELGRHFRELLTKGVATNLTLAAKDIPAQSLANRELLQVRSKVKQLTQRLEDQLKRSTDPDAQGDFRLALAAISEGRAGVEEALEGRSVPDDRT